MAGSWLPAAPHFHPGAMIFFIGRRTVESLGQGFTEDIAQIRQQKP
jgi:hypothetical protein